MTGEKERHTRLQKLSGSDFEMTDGQSDIRGWAVKDAAGKQLGSVKELIFDYQSRKVRYLVVDLHNNEYGLETKEVLVPIGLAELHEADDDVVLNGVEAEQLNELPEYSEERFETEDEASIRNVFGGLGSAALNGGSEDDFYNHHHFNENNLYRNRRAASAASATERQMQMPDETTAQNIHTQKEQAGNNDLTTNEEQRQ